MSGEIEIGAWDPRRACDRRQDWMWGPATQRETFSPRLSFDGKAKMAAPRSLNDVDEKIDSKLGSSVPELHFEDVLVAGQAGASFDLLPLPN